VGAVLFNPFIPIRFAREYWQALDWITIAGFAWVLLITFNKATVKTGD